MTEKPDNFALLIGAMKCGTSTLFEYLASHPQIAASREKEPNFFGDTEHYARGMQWYRQLWDWDDAVHKIAIEASTQYAKQPAHKRPPERIAAATDCRFQFIYIMRHPIKRIESHRIHRMDGRWKHGPGDARLITDLELSYSRYAMQLDKYYERFEGDRILLLIMEEMVADPQTTARRVFDFLKVDPSFEIPLIQARNTRNQRADAPMVQNLRKLPLARTLGKVLPTSSRKKIKDRLRRKSQETMKITDAEYETIMETLRPDLIRLRERYGVDAEKTWGIPL